MNEIADTALPSHAPRRPLARRQCARPNCSDCATVPRLPRWLSRRSSASAGPPRNGAPGAKIALRSRCIAPPPGFPTTATSGPSAAVAESSASAELLENWPVLTKDALRRNARALVADDCEHRAHVLRAHQRDFRQAARSVVEPRDDPRLVCPIRSPLPSLVRTLAPGSMGHPRRAVSRAGLSDQAPFWVWNAGLRQLYLSVYHMSPALAPSYVDALRSYRVTYIVGYPSALDAIAESAFSVWESATSQSALSSPTPNRCSPPNAATSKPHSAAPSAKPTACPRSSPPPTSASMAPCIFGPKPESWKFSTTAGPSLRRRRRPREHRSHEPRHALDPLSHRRPLRPRRR